MLQLKGLGSENNNAVLLTSGVGWHNGAILEQSSRFTISMVKPLNLLENFLKLVENVIDIIMSWLNFMFGRNLTIFADKQGIEVGNLAKCVNLLEVGKFHIIISVTNMYYFTPSQW